jgi:hypothetical protein
MLLSVKAFMIYLLLPPFQNIRASPAGPCIASARGRTGPTGHAPAVRRIRTDASGPTHRSTKFGSQLRRRGLSARVLPCGSRPHLAAAQRARAMLVKGWARRLAFCCAAPSFCSMLRHWQPAAPLDARRGHFNASVWASAPSSNAIRSFQSGRARPVEHTDAAFSLVPHRCSPHHRRAALARPWLEALDRGEGG